MSRTSDPLLIAPRGDKTASLLLTVRAEGPARLAAERVCTVAREELGLNMDVRADDARRGDIFALCPPWDDASSRLLQEAGMELDEDGRLPGLASAPSRDDQGFVAARATTSRGDRLLLAGKAEMGLRNALLTLADRLYRDQEGNVVVDPFCGAHLPAFETRHIKTDAMNCGAFRALLDYWDPATPHGVDEFAGWLASFRITDYDFLAFMRGWGITYPSSRFPALVDPQHPNSTLDFYPRLIDRLHAWGIRVWASDIYLASGYTMETATAPEMLSPCADATRLQTFKAGAGSFSDLLHDPEAVVCLSNPAAAKFYADVVDDLLQHYPALDGLGFHIGHTFPNKICRCPACKDLGGNREGVYRCFAQVYRTAVARRPDIRMKTAVMMFGDATRRLVERWEEFPRLEFFCWLRWVDNLRIERTDAPVLLGHEDGGGGLEANHDPAKTLGKIRDYFRDYEPWLHTYVRIARRAGLKSLSWEPALHRELEHMFFFNSQLTWEPDLTWEELARRWVIRSERRLDRTLIEAYRLALEANAAVTHWGLADYEPGSAHRVVQTRGLLEMASVRERVAALGEALSNLGLANMSWDAPPVAFELRRSLIKTWQRLKAGEVLGQWH